MIMVGAATILAFATIGSLAARRFGSAYSKLVLGSFAIYLVVGFSATCAGALMPSMLAGAMTGLVESTLGWAISWRIGPGRPAVDNVAPPNILRTVAVVTVLGAVIGTIGGWLRQSL